jgi:hypothetical protein
MGFVGLCDDDSGSVFEVEAAGSLVLAVSSNGRRLHPSEPVIKQ